MKTPLDTLLNDALREAEGRLHKACEKAAMDAVGQALGFSMNCWGEVHAVDQAFVEGLRRRVDPQLIEDLMAEAAQHAEAYLRKRSAKAVGEKAAREALENLTQEVKAAVNEACDEFAEEAKQHALGRLHKEFREVFPELAVMGRLKEANK